MEQRTEPRKISQVRCEEQAADDDENDGAGFRSKEHAGGSFERALQFAPRARPGRAPLFQALQCLSLADPAHLGDLRNLLSARSRDPRLPRIDRIGADPEKLSEVAGGQAEAVAM